MKPSIINAVFEQYKNRSKKILCFHLPPPFRPLFTNTHMNTLLFTKVNGKVTCSQIMNANLLSINTGTSYLVKVVSHTLSVYLT